MSSPLGQAAIRLARAESDYEDATRLITRLDQELNGALQKQSEANFRVGQAKQTLLEIATHERRLSEGE